MRIVNTCALLLLPVAAIAADAVSPALPSSSEYRIGPEDTLVITVWQNAELSRKVPVRPDGKISLPLLNDIQAAGLTAMDLRNDIAARLKEYVPAAEVSVIVEDVRSFTVSVIGKVRKPDRYRLGAPTTVLDALALAGGLDEFADGDRIVVLRPRPFDLPDKPTATTFQRLQFNYRRVVTAGGESGNFALQAGDIVYVP